MKGSTARKIIKVFEWAGFVFMMIAVAAAAGVLTLLVVCVPGAEWAVLVIALVLGAVVLRAEADINKGEED